MTAPLRIDLDLACSVEHAFDTWTSRIDTWWPSDHTVSGQRGVEVVLERSVGGRIYERSPEGVEHDWGVVTRWEPPSRLAYLWHIGRGPDDATDVEIRFVAQDDTHSRIEIEHRGWERFGETAGAWRDRNQIGWDTVLGHFIAQITQGDS